MSISSYLSCVNPSKKLRKQRLRAEIRKVNGLKNNNCSMSDKLLTNRNQKALESFVKLDLELLFRIERKPIDKNKPDTQYHL